MCLHVGALSELEHRPVVTYVSGWESFFAKKRVVRHSDGQLDPLLVFFYLADI